MEKRLNRLIFQSRFAALNSKLEKTEIWVNWFFENNLLLNRKVEEHKAYSINSPS